MDHIECSRLRTDQNHRHTSVAGIDSQANRSDKIEVIQRRAGRGRSQVHLHPTEHASELFEVTKLQNLPDISSIN